MKKLSIIGLLLILISGMILAGCSNTEPTEATYSCCDIGCISTSPCSQYDCPPAYHYESGVDQCVKDSGTSVLGQVCFPDNTNCNEFVSTYENDCFLGILNNWFDCEKATKYRTACNTEESSLYCKNAYWSNGYYYCDIDNVRFCESGCNNGVCEDVTPNDCINGYEKCGSGSFADEDGDIYRCNGGQWQLEQSCDEICEEKSNLNAICRGEWKYCIGQNAPNCNLCTTSFGYDTLEECEDNIAYYCLSSDKTECIKREGKDACNSGELSHWANSNAGGAEGAKSSCENQICGQEGKTCCADDKCGFGLSCEEQLGLTDAHGNPVSKCIKNNDNCEQQCETKAWFAIGTKVIVPNYLCIKECELLEYFFWLKIGLTAIVAMLVFAITLIVLRQKLTKKKDKKLIWIITSLATVVLSAMFYFYFIVWFILFVIYIIGLIAFSVLKAKIK